MTSALDGVKVLDLCHNGPGLLATGMLGDLGADVLRIQDPRDVSARAGGGADSAYARNEAARQNPAYSLNRNKRSIALNLKADAGKQVFYRLVQDADVVVEGFRPGVAARLGVDYATLQEVNPRVICASVSGYGQNGPYRDYVGHDVNYLAFGGALGITGREDTGPVIPGFQFGDFAGGTMFTVAGVMAALLAREKTGRGQYVDVSMTDGVLALMASLYSGYQISGKPPRRAGQPTNGATPYYSVYECADGQYISLGVVEPRFWEELCRGLDRPDLMPLQDQTEEYPRIREEFRQAFKQRTRDDWWEHLKNFDICVGKVLDFEELADDPQLQARGMILEVQDEQGNTYRQVSSGFNLSDTPPTVRRLAPERGAQTDEVLAQAGFPADEIARLRREGTIA